MIGLRGGKIRMREIKKLKLCTNKKNLVSYCRNSMKVNSRN